MAKYDIIYSCGHEGCENIIGPTKNRQWIADRKAAGLCSECYRLEVEQKRTAENEANAQKASEQELPELLGSLKQIPYGETCRQKLIAQLEVFLDEILERSNRRKDADPVANAAIVSEAQEVIQFAMRSKNTARWWIDTLNETYNYRELLDRLKIEMKAEVKIEAQIPKEELPIPDPLATIRPECAKSETIAQIRVVENLIEVHFPERRDDFYKLVKETLKLTWNSGRWERKIVNRNGTVEDRAAEIGHRILAKGFIVRIENKEIREKAVAGDYEPECTSWIGRRADGPQMGWFYITWAREDDYYKAARKISGSRYDSPGVAVPANHFDEVLDFAQQYDFKLSKQALEVVESAKLDREQAICVSVSEPQEREPVVADGIPSMLIVPKGVDIDEEFKETQTS